MVPGVSSTFSRVGVRPRQPFLRQEYNTGCFRGGGGVDMVAVFGICTATIATLVEAKPSGSVRREDWWLGRAGVNIVVIQWTGGKLSGHTVDSVYVGKHSGHTVDRG